jgi:hypothetical protein
MTDMCEACGQKIRKLNPHRMCRHKAWMLVLLDRARRAGKPWVKVSEGDFIEVGGHRHKAPYCARAHAMRLTWFGLAETTEERRTGEYRITHAGSLFLQGRATVPKVIYCQDGEVVRESEERVGLDDIKNVVLTKAYWDQYANLQIERDQPCPSETSTSLAA